LQFESVDFDKNAKPAEKPGFAFLLLKYKHGRPNTKQSEVKSHEVYQRPTTNRKGAGRLPATDDSEAAAGSGKVNPQTLLQL